MCSPIKFTRPGARTSCTGPAEEPNASANAAVRSVEVMRLIRSRSFAPAALRMTRALAPGIIEELLLHAVGEVEDLLGSEVREQRRMDVANVLREAGTAAVVVHDDLQEVRVLSDLAVILLGAVER